MQYKKRKRIAMPVVAIFIATFLIAGAASVYAAVDDHTVQGKNPQGTVISLFDYWVDGQNSVDYSPTPNLNSGINKNRDLKFNKGQGDGFNGWTGGKTPYSGMVEKTLNSNGYPNLATSWTNGIFYTSPLDYLFNENDSTTKGDARVEGKKAYTNVDGLMQVDDDGYYYYDSTKNFASYDSSANSVKLYEKPGVYYRGTPGQFFPFNSGSDVFSESNGSISAKTSVNAESNNVNHWFGASMSTHFMHPEGGKTTRNQDITYEFSGDDDVWVFIDDVLVGDLGGIHDAASLKINFSTGAVSINGKSDGTLKSKYEAAGKSSETGWNGNTYAGGTYHTLKFFYLERGNYASNMSLKFNLKLMPDNEAYKVDQDENALSGATFALYEAEKKDGEYTKKGGQLCKGVTDAGGSLKLKADDGATINFEELYKKDVGPYFILEETEAPAGYRSAKDVWLKYDPKTGVITTENLWDTGIQANARIMVTAPADLYDINGNKIEINDEGQLTKGSIFAVIHKRYNLENVSDPNNWSSISGSVLTGWKVKPDKGLASALTGNKYEFKLNSMAAYETTLDELPGDITTYVNTIVNENEGKSTKDVLKELQEHARYSLGFYYTTGSVEGATVENTVRLNDGIGMIASNHNAKRFEYQYAVKLTVTDVTNDLYVKKFKKDNIDLKNQDGALNGVTFALYREDQTTLGSHILPGDPVLKGDAVPVATRTTETLNDPYRGDDSGTACFSKLENGIYYLKEISAPSGYKVRDDLIKVVVNDYGVFADAGAENDGIYVGRGGYGTLLKSMEQFAVNDDIDNTLTNVQVNLRVSSKEPNEEGFWNNGSQLKHDQPLHLKYLAADGTNGKSRYQVYDPDNGETDEIQDHADFFMTDTGWPSLSLKQCNEHKTDNPYAQRTELGDKELLHLFVLRTMVLMEDEAVGDLEISKTVKNDSSDTRFDKGFEFNVNLRKTTKDDDGRETTSPVSGTFQYVVKGPGATDSTEKELVVNGEGNASLQLKDGQTAVIEDLPAGTEYQVTEDLGDKTFWDVKSSVDGGVQAASRISRGKIPEPAEDGSKQKSTVAYENTYHPAAALASIPVEKQFNGWTLPGFKDETFDIRLTGIESTGGNIKDTMPGATQDTVDSDWYLIKTVGKRNDGQNGSVSDAVFDGMTFTKTGAYAYTVKEIRGSQGGITYSSAIYEVLITVTDDKEGKLTAAMTMKKAIDDNGEALQEKPQADKAVFQNRYSSQEKGISFIVHKTYSNATGSDQLTDNQFQFQLEAVTEGAPMPENTADGKSIAPSTPGGRVDFPNTTFDTSDQEKTFVYKVSEVIPDGAENGTLNGTTYDRNAYYIQVAVTVEGGSGAGVNTEIKYYRDAACKDEIKPGSEDLYQAEQGVYRLWFKNSYTATPAKVAIQGSKTLDGRDMKAGEFSFTLEGANGTTSKAMEDGSITGATAGKLTVQVAAASDGHEQGFKFPDLTFNHVGTYTFNVKETIPDGAKNNTLKGVTYDTNVGTVTVQVTDKDANGNKTGRLTATVSYTNSRNDSTDLAKFVNSYEESGSYAITGTKNITGRSFQKGDSYTFTVTPKDDKTPYPVDKDGKKVKEVTITPDSGDSANIDFGTVNFTKAGQSYEYTLKEKKPSDDSDTKGITYDNTTYTLTLTSRANDPKDGKLVIDQTLTAGDKSADSIAWTNTYRATGSMELKGSKTLTGRKWQDGDAFTFTLWAKADDTTLLSNVKNSYTVDEAGRAIFKSVTVDEKAAGNNRTVTLDFGNLNFIKDSDGKPYEFYITETIPRRDEIRGIQYDGSDHRIPVYVTDDGQGHLTAEVAENSITNLDFYNIYSSSIEYSNEAGIVIEKTLSGRDMTDGQFEFTVEALESGSGDTKVAKEEAAARIGFGQGQTKKTYQSKAASDGQKCIIDILDGEKVRFTQDDADKTFRYKVKETRGGGAGYTNDTEEYQVEITLFDDGNGVLTAKTKVKDKDDQVISEVPVDSADVPQTKQLAVVPFTNSYSASGSLGGQGSAKIKADKTLTGRAMKADEFTFNITNAKDTAEQKTIVSSGKNKAAADGNAGDIDFAEIKYTTAKLKFDVAAGLAVKENGKYIYQYIVSEETDKLPAGVSPVEAAFAVTVTVTDNGDGTLTAEVGYPDVTNKLSFSNKYDTSQVSVPIKGVKSLNTINGTSLTIKDIEGKYDFALTGKETTGGAEKDAPMPSLNGKKMTKASNDVTGEIDFGDITLEASDFDGITPDDQGVRTRTFEYQITESGSVSGIVNDHEATKKVTVTVKYNSKEKTFAVEGLPGGAAFQFTNTYGVEAVSADAGALFTVNKKLTGRDLKAGEFRFELLEVSDDGEAQVIATGTNEAAAAGEPAKVDFGRITYDRPGEHDYLIREIVPEGGVDLNTVYDTRTYSVHVSVTDQKDGTLKVTSDAAADKPFTFVNKQVKKNPSGGDDPSGDAGNHGGIGGQGTRTGDTTPLGLAILLMMAAACAATLVLGLRKQQE